MRGWQTPRASDGDKGGPNQTLKGRPSLVAQARSEEWATPAAGLANYTEPPETFAARSEALEARGSRPLGVNLGQQAQAWQPSTALARPTPAARDSKGANGPEHLAKERGHHDQLPNAVALFDGHPGPVTSTGGPESSPATRISRRLNPAFVTWLMGWPEGWETPGLIPSDSSGTAVFLNK